ncbi:MAG: hypothetical protein JNJ44_06190 [Zoogloeaceae bacterium]|nr:hypothetical protein [Zoogloeaceae bacterium]
MPFPSRGTSQRGAATLLVSMVLLIAATLVVLYTSQTTVTEQRMSANEVRMKQALAAAQAGVDAALAGLNAGNDLSVAPNTGGLGASPKGSYQAVYCNGTLGNAALPTCPAAPAALACTAPVATAAQSWLVACGWSDDNTSIQRIVTYIGKLGPVPNAPSNPLISKGGVNVGGNATVVNYFNNLTTWTGASLTSSSATGKTMVRNPSTTYQTSYETTPSDLASAVQGNSGCGAGNNLVCTTTSGLAGPDVVASDTTLSNLNDAQFFANFFGMSPGMYKASADKVLTNAQAGVSGAFATPQVYWVDVPAGDTFTLNQNIGTLNGPVVLVVNGDLQLNASNDFYGLLYVTGNVTGGGSPNIFGSMVVEGSVSSNGAPNIIYYPKVFENLDDLGKWSSMPGTWRDF